MKLKDYEKQAGMMFGDCPGCEDCTTCRVRSLIAHVWESGRRSGSASSAERASKAITWKEMDWTAEVVEALVSYVLKVFPAWSMEGREAALITVQNEMEKAYLWQGSKDKVIKKLDWTLFMMKWLRGKAEQVQAGTPVQAQANLFDSPSQPPSVQSRREEGRGETYRLMTRVKSVSGPR